MEEDAMPNPSAESATLSLPPFKSTNNKGASLPATLERLSPGPASNTTLPDSSPIALHSLFLSPDYNNTTLAGAQSPSPTLLRRTTSSTSIGTPQRSRTPILHKKTSVSSLQGIGGITPPRSPTIRRTSSNLLSSPQSVMPPKSLLRTAAEETPQAPVLTAASHAHECFERELELHGEAHRHTYDTAAVVILHNACYGHRYARPRTSKASLSTIVERPERIHATILGLAAAYVRLGGRHTEGRGLVQRRDDFSHLNSIPFRIQTTSRTTSLTSQAVTNVHGTKWMEELSIMCRQAEAKLATNGKELVRPKGLTKDGEGEDQPKLHDGDLYLCSESLDALEGTLGGVCEAVDTVFLDSGPKRAFVCVRPPGHHCSADYPSGFCWLNNVHVGISHASVAHGLTHAVIVDFDLHHGDGSQAIAWAHNAKVAGLPKNAATSKKTSIAYFSLHDINSYPCEWGDEDKVRNASLCLENSHSQTIWNVHLQPWKDDAEFWKLYKERYSILITKARVYLRLQCEKLRASAQNHRPKAAIFVSAGFDASEWESSGMQRHKVNVPTDFYARFTRDIVALANEEGLGVDGRVISVLEGGYSDRALTSGAMSHMCGLTASEANEPLPITDGPGHEMSQRLSGMKLDGDTHDASKASDDNHTMPVDPQWWTLSCLAELENLVNPPPPSVLSKRPRSALAPTYTIPTESFTAKIVSPPQGRRSASGSAILQRSSSSASSKAPTPPPPDVDWATAAHELCKLLIPTDRQTKSYIPEELNAEASRARRDRQSAMGVPVETTPVDVTSKHMQLRGRKSKTPSNQSDEDELKPVPRASRRRTIAGAAILDLQDPPRQQGTSVQAGGNTSIVSSRHRLSVTSSVITPIDADAMSASTSLTLGTSSDYVTNITERRSSSSSSVRPGSPTSNGLGLLAVVKKARAPSTSRSVGSDSKAHVTRKPPPVPRVPSAYSKAPALKDPNVPLRTQDVGSKAPNLVNKDVGNGDLDQLSLGMRKMSIKLNVRPRDDQKATQEKKKPVGRPPRKSIAGKSAKPIIAKTPLIDHPPELTLTSSETAIDKPIADGSIETKLSEAETHSLSIPRSVPSRNQMMPQTINPLPVSFMPPNSDAVPAVASEPHVQIANRPSFDIKTSLQGPLTLPPPIDQTSSSSLLHSISSPISPKRTQHDLPAFTSTSPIPFGVRTGKEMNMDRVVDFALNCVQTNVQNASEGQQDIPSLSASAAGGGANEKIVSSVEDV